MSLRIPTPAGTPVRVYRNLHTQSWSIQAKLPTGRGRARQWYVVGHADAVALDRCRFKVSEKGRQRVLATGRKNVHAWVIGRLLGVDDELPLAIPEGPEIGRLAYNPRRVTGFVPAGLLAPDAPAITSIRPYQVAERVWLTSTGRVHAQFPGY